MTKELETIINALMFPTARSRDYAHDGTSYPPYNIYRDGENATILEMALAGFKESELNVVVEDRNLKISGRKETTTSKSDGYIYKGIATRSFEKTFTLRNGSKVLSAEYADGILTVKVSYEIPEEKKPKQIPISQKSEKEFLTE
jgi:molecular chaperone IbpA